MTTQIYEKIFTPCLSRLKTICTWSGVASMSWNKRYVNRSKTRSNAEQRSATLFSQITVLLKPSNTRTGSVASVRATGPLLSTRSSLFYRKKLCRSMTASYFPCAFLQLPSTTANKNYSNWPRKPSSEHCQLTLVDTRWASTKQLTETSRLTCWPWKRPQVSAFHNKTMPICSLWASIKP